MRVTFDNETASDFVCVMLHALDVALLLASDAAGSFITGEELIVDGGYHVVTI